jgi:GTP cyclohydrolase II
VRVQSACYTAEIFRSQDCDCHEQLVSSLHLITRKGGLLIYMLCDGRGAGLYNKVLGLELTRTQGLDTADAYRKLGIELDPRRYARAAQVISHLGIGAVSLLTNNPRKCHGLEAEGIAVKRVPLEILATSSSRQYLRAKAHKLGHQLTQFDADP